MTDGDQDGTKLVTLKSNDSSSHGSNEFLGSLTSRNRTRTYTRWSPIEEGVTLAWSDLYVSARIKKKGKVTYKRIISGVSGAMKAGSLVALMGASGSGKSTLMSALAFRHTGTMEIEGDVLVNGRQIGGYMKYLSGYMHQEDLFVSCLTVREHMTIMANLKLDRRITAEGKSNKINELLTQLGLSECLDTRIGGIDQTKALSGGEKKRLAFATELLTDPPVLFCDEPTTGLDSYSAQKLVTMMNLMASCGKTILCTIHQPSSDIFAMFSQLILVADGKIAYMGATAKAIDFFEQLGYTCPSSYSPADFFIKLIANTPGHEVSSKQATKSICDHFAVSDYAKEIDIVVQYEFHMGRAVMVQDDPPKCLTWYYGIAVELEENLKRSRCRVFPRKSDSANQDTVTLQIYRPRHFKLKKNFIELHWLSKLYWLTYRWFLEVLRNPTVQSLKIFQRVIIGVIVGLCYLGTNPYTQNGIQSIQGAIVMFVSENTFNPMYAVLAEFPENSPIFLREYKSGLYNPLIYYLSRIIALIPGFILEPVLFVITAYWLSDLQPSAYAFFMTTMITILIMNVSSACGIMFSNAFDSVPSAMAYLVPFDYILMITSGIYIKLSTLPSLLSWTKYLSWLMYGTESLTILQWKGITNITCENEQLDLPCITEGRAVLDKYGFSEDHLWRDIWSMVILIVGFYIVGYLCLLRKIKYK